jgi:hypothetical protein
MAASAAGGRTSAAPSMKVRTLALIAFPQRKSPVHSSAIAIVHLALARPRAPAIINVLPPKVVKRAHVRLTDPGAEATISGGRSVGRSHA